jgi:hypothetical protein
MVFDSLLSLEVETRSWLEAECAGRAYHRWFQSNPRNAVANLLAGVANVPTAIMRHATATTRLRRVPTAHASHEPRISARFLVSYTCLAPSRDVPVWRT